MVSPWPPRTEACTSSTLTLSSIETNARKRAESSTPADGEGAPEGAPPTSEPPKPTHALLLYDDEPWADAPPAEMEELMNAYMAYSAALVEGGAMVGGEALEPCRTATTVRLRDGKRLVQDGPYADSKEQLGGFYLVNAADPDKAAEWASKCPAAQSGGVEVRPVETPHAG